MDQIQVRFRVHSYVLVDRAPEITGKITRDGGKRGKIVFLNGFKNNWRTWCGQLPQDGEEWVCEVVRDTAPATPHKGALLVRLVRKAEPKLWWDCRPNAEVPELFGTRLPKVTCVTRIGVREERTDDYRVSCTEDIKADWPEEICSQASAMLSDYAAAKERFTGLIQWPTLPSSDPGSLTYEVVEVGGYQCRINTYVSVGVNGLERYWSLTGPLHVPGPTQLLSDQLKAEPGKSFIATSYVELRALCELFGKPGAIEAAFHSDFGNSVYDRGTAKWNDFQISLNPKALFDGPHKVNVTSVDSYGNVTARVELLDLDFAAEVKGFKIEPEKQQAICRLSGDWMPYSGIGFGQYQTKAEPVVKPARVNWAATRHLTEEQRRELVAGADKWSLADHAYFFRAALMETGVVSGAQKDADLLRQLVAEKDFAINNMPFKVSMWEPESPDGMRSEYHWTETYYYPCLIHKGHQWDTVYARLDSQPELVGNLDAAIRWYVAEVAERLRRQVADLRQAFTAKARYEEQPPYAQPADTIRAEEKQEVSRKANELLDSLQQVLNEADAMLAQEDYSIRKAKEAEAERKRCEEIRAQALELCGLPYFDRLGWELREKVQIIAGTLEESWRWTPPKFASMDADELRAWQEVARRDLEEFRSADQSAKEVHRQIERGEVLADYGGHFRVMGSTGQAQYWVILPDGSQREPDQISYRKRYSSEGEKRWQIVVAGELAIAWFKSDTASPHEFMVDKLPTGGCMPEQLETVARLEKEIQENWEGRTGISGRACPDIGLGWNLRPTLPPDKEESKSGPVDLSTVQTLFGGVPVIRRKK